VASSSSWLPWPRSTLRWRLGRLRWGRPLLLLLLLLRRWLLWLLCRWLVLCRVAVISTASSG
jgi:hypothetical protein